MLSKVQGVAGFGEEDATMKRATITEIRIEEGYSGAGEGNKQFNRSNKPFSKLILCLPVGDFCCVVLITVVCFLEQVD